MKIKKIIHGISDIIDTDQLDITNLHFFKIFSLPIWLVILSISLSFATKSVRAGTEDIHQNFRYVPYEGPKSTTGTDTQRPKQSSGASDTEAKKAIKGEQATSSGGAESANQAKESAGTRSEEAKKTDSSEQAKKTGENTKPSPKDTGQFPAFSQVDVNGDHYVTKDELQNFPELLRVFDKVDAGKDGRLEQHEFQNLEMETRREGEIS